uniref:Uncharacterized protein n=1 Tax=Meloidogyne enterolobii TaxID=390850 RepID=A0A6V7TTM7_MELEN|nr:unnamed protein product [Meloidogyne enterolobii]
MIVDCRSDCLKKFGCLEEQGCLELEFSRLLSLSKVVRRFSDFFCCHPVFQLA